MESIMNLVIDFMEFVCLSVKATDIVKGVRAFVPTPLMKQHCQKSYLCKATGRGGGSLPLM